MIQERREDIMQNNNTAQQQFADILESLNKRADVLQFREPFHGDLNLAILREMGFGAVQKLIFMEGDITSIENIPEGITHFECPMNLLVTLNGLPHSLETLIVSNNYLTTIPVESLENLKILNVTDNQIRELENLPSSLVELRCDNNRLERLDLHDLVNLQVLHISNNGITLIENLPEGIADFQMENTPDIEFRNSATDPAIVIKKTAEANVNIEAKVLKQRDYVESLHEYFRIKQRYEKDANKVKKRLYKSMAGASKKAAKQAAAAFRPKCIKCKRDVGTLFTLKNNRYSAICGDAQNPCKLDIQIFAGIIFNLENILDIYRESTEEAKDLIIRQKLDTLFSYVQEEESIKLFKKELELYTKDNKMYQHFVQLKNELFHSEHKEKLIEQKNVEIFRLKERIQTLLDEYVKTKNREFMRTAMNMQIKELMPEIRNLRMLKYGIMEMHGEGYGKEFSLFKFPVTLYRLEGGEPPRVIKFNL